MRRKPVYEYLALLCKFCTDMGLTALWLIVAKSLFFEGDNRGDLFFLNLLLRLNQSDGHVTGTMTPANCWRLFIPHYVPVLDHFQPRCRNRPVVGREKRLSAVSPHDTSRLPTERIFVKFCIGRFLRSWGGVFLLLLKVGKNDKTLFMKASLQLYCIAVWEKNEKYGSFREVRETVDDLNIACCNVPSETQKNCCFAKWTVYIILTCSVLWRNFSTTT